jgi:hypothetical protein
VETTCSRSFYASKRLLPLLDRTSDVRVYRTTRLTLHNASTLSGALLK